MNSITDNYVLFAVALSYLSRYASVHAFATRPMYLIFDMLLYSALCEWVVDLLAPPNTHGFIAMIIMAIAVVIMYFRLTGRIKLVQTQDGEIDVDPK